jgi:hypothetical protein
MRALVNHVLVAPPLCSGRGQLVVVLDMMARKEERKK